MATGYVDTPIYVRVTALGQLRGWLVYHTSPFLTFWRLRDGLYTCESMATGYVATPIYILVTALGQGVVRLKKEGG